MVQRLNKQQIGLMVSFVDRLFVAGEMELVAKYGVELVVMMDLQLLGMKRQPRVQYSKHVMAD